MSLVADASTPTPATTRSAVSGQAMDRRVRRRRLPSWTRVAGAFLAAGVLLAGALATIAPGRGRTLAIDGSLVTIATVTRAVFEDFIPVRARVKPLHTIYLDAMEGGRVERVHVDDGAAVHAGQLLVELSNTTIQLDVVSREAQVIEQLNQLRIIELNLETARLQHRREVAELEYQTTHAGRVLDRQQKLRAGGHIAEAELVDAADQYESLRMRLEIAREASRSEEELRANQLVALRHGTQQLEQNLRVARTNLESLAIKAPVAGQITALRAEVGQSLARGERIGQLDDPSHSKLVASIDEYYLARVEVGQTATVEWGGRPHTLRITKTYPQVRDGQFEADLSFTAEQPAGLRRGQTLQGRLSLGDPGPPQLVVRNGAFYQDTGGAWVFVVSAGGTEAVRRTVRLGRRNNDFIEVLDGLSAGESIVTSPYKGLLDKDRLQLQAPRRP